MKQLFLGALLFISFGSAYAQGTPESWRPTVFNLINNHKVYDYWGGHFGAAPFIGSTAEESADYYCEVRGFGSPHRNGEIRSDQRYYFDCPDRFGGLPGLWRFTHSCEFNEQIIVVDISPFTSAFLTCTESDDPGKDQGCNANNFANPCNVSNGNKHQSETDITNGIPFTRSYNSLNLASVGLGRGWRHNHQQKLIVSNDSLTQVSGSGRGEPWVKSGGVWSGDPDSDVLIGETESANNVIETYNLRGQLTQVEDTNGSQTAYAYTANGLLSQITNEYGQSLSFTYDGERLSSVVDLLGNVYQYEYDANDNLSVVVYPDETPNDDSDNPRKIYHYENTTYPHHLTGITDENGSRYATWSYNSEGKAISTEHAPTTNAIGQERFELDYQVEAAQ